MTDDETLIHNYRLALESMGVRADDMTDEQAMEQIGELAPASWLGQFAKYDVVEGFGRDIVRVGAMDGSDWGWALCQWQFGGRIIQRWDGRGTFIVRGHSGSLRWITPPSVEATLATRIILPLGGRSVPSLITSCRTSVDVRWQVTCVSDFVSNGAPAEVAP